MEEEQVLVCFKPDEISWEEITALLHTAYKIHLKCGLEYKAASQSVEETKMRNRGGACLVCLLNYRLIGTATLHIRNNAAYLTQIAVEPLHKNRGIGQQLLQAVVKTAREAGVRYIYCDTAESAKTIVHWYLKNGWRKIGLVSWPSTNYYSILFRYDLENKQRGICTAIRYFLQRICCKLLVKKSGQVRELFSPFYTCLIFIYKKYFK